MLRLGAEDRTVERCIEIHQADDVTLGTGNGARKQVPDGVGASARDSLHAKRVLGAGGSLSEALGVELRAGDIARAMRTEDLHGDVHHLFDRIGTLSGVSPRDLEVVIRSS
jgi:hypothetical protein